MEFLTFMNSLNTWKTNVSTFYIVALARNIGLVNRLITQNRQMVKALYDSRNEFLKTERYNKLKQIESKIDSALTANTIESIQDQFEQFN